MSDAIRAARPARRLLAALAILLVGTPVFAAPAQDVPRSWEVEFPKTDFSRSSLDSWDEIISGGPPRDGIPALSDVSFHAVADESRLNAREPVIALEIDGQTPRAYPIRYLIWHEIVNDRVGGTPVAVTFCPLCNSALVFDRRLGGKLLSFGVSGKLRSSDMVMYDHESESWWQQAIGTGIVGEYNGRELEQVPSWLESWAEFSARNPDGLVMRQPDFNRDYGRNPYVKYDSSTRPFLFDGEMPDNGVPALMRVVRVANRAWPMDRLAAAGEISEAGLTISWAAGQASALDTARIGDARDVGTIRVRDGSGRDVAHDVMFAFAFHAFFPDGEWMLGR